MRRTVLLLVSKPAIADGVVACLQSSYNVFVANTIEEVEVDKPVDLLICSEALSDDQRRLLHRQLKGDLSFAPLPVLALSAADWLEPQAVQARLESLLADRDAALDLIKKISEYIDAHTHDRRLNAEALARHMHMSRPTLYRKIKIMTVLTPNELINQARLKQASVLLARGHYKVYDVARMVGFQSQSSFGKAFLKEFNITPTAYRQHMKQLFIFQ